MTRFLTFNNNKWYPIYKENDIRYNETPITS